MSGADQAAAGVRHFSDLARYVTGRDGVCTYTMCDELLADGRGRVLPPFLPDAPVCEVCEAEQRRRQGG